MNMLATTAHITTPRESCEIALLDVAAFVERHGLVLYELVELMEDDSGADAVLDLIGLCATALPDHRAVAAALSKVRSALERASSLQLDEVAQAGAAPFEVHGAVRWAGARVTDLCARLGMG